MARKSSRGTIYAPVNHLNPFLIGGLYEGPIAALISKTDIETANNTASIQVVVRYTAQGGRNVVGSTLGADVFLVSESRGVTIPMSLTFVDIAGNAPILTATYTAAPIGGTWFNSSNALYEIQVGEGLVSDSGGNDIIKSTVGSVAIDVSGGGVVDTTAPTIVLNNAPLNPILSAGTYDFNVTVTDASSDVDRASLVLGFVIEAPGGARTVLANQTLTPATDAQSITGDWRFDFSTFDNTQDGVWKLIATTVIQDTAGNAIAEAQLGTITLALQTLVFSGVTTAQAGQTVRAQVTSTGAYRVDWGDGTESTEADYADHDYTDAATDHTVRIYASDPSLITRLVLNSSRYSSVSEISNSLTGITQIRINTNSLTAIPLHPEWVNLADLWINGNKITAVTLHPEWVNLTELRIGGNSLSAVTLHPEWVNLYELRIQANSLSAVTLHPEWVGLAKLNISSNDLTTVTLHPEWVNLDSFLASNNQLSAVTLHSEWVNLTDLRLTDNLFTAPVTLHPEWVKLTTLFYNINDFGAVTLHPEWIELTNLYINSIKLTAVTLHPEWVKLRNLDLNGNLIADLNPTYAGLIAAGNPNTVASRALNTELNPGSAAVTAANLTQVNTIAGWAVTN